MDRPIWYTQENLRGYDLSMGARDAFKGSGQQASDILGGTTAVVAGLIAAASNPISLVVNIGPGSIYQQAVLDPTPAGDLPIDGNTHFLQGVSWAAQPVTLTTAGLSSGQSKWALIEAAFAFADVIRSGDPNGGVLPFYNSSNPTSPLQGQGGSGGSLDTERTATVSFQVKYGTPATTGSEAPPSADVGYVGLYLIDIAYGQTTIAQNQILTAGPSVGANVPSNYPYAPFLAGLLNQHHKGIAGQAPQIDLTSEVKNILPNANTTGAIAATANTLALRDGSGDLTANQFNISSDRRLKKNIRRINGATEKLRKLGGYLFNWRATGAPSVGPLAQELQDVLPECVQGDPRTVNPMGPIGLLIEGFNDLDRRISKLERR